MSDQKQQIIEDIVSNIHKNGKQQITGPVLQGVLVNMTEGLAAEDELSGKQDKLISGTNIKTINGKSVLGEGDITIVSSTNADWAENNPTSLSYINNRTHYEAEENGYLQTLLYYYIKNCGDSGYWSIGNHIGELTITPTDTGDPESAIRTDVPYKLFMVMEMVPELPAIAKYKCIFKYGNGSLLFDGINVIYEIRPGPVMPGKPTTYIPVVTEIYSDKVEDDVNVVDTIVGNIYYPKKLDNRFLNIDKTVQSNSTYPVTSGAVYDAIQGIGTNNISFHIDTSDEEHVIVDDEENRISVNGIIGDLINSIKTTVDNGGSPTLTITIDDNIIMNQFQIVGIENWSEGGVEYTSYLFVNPDDVLVEMGAPMLYNIVELFVTADGSTQQMTLSLQKNENEYLNVPDGTELSTSLDDIGGSDENGIWDWRLQDDAYDKVPTCGEVNEAFVYHWSCTHAEAESGYRFGYEEFNKYLNRPIWRTSDGYVYFKVPFICSELKTIMNDHTPDPESDSHGTHAYHPKTVYSNDNDLLILYRREIYEDVPIWKLVRVNVGL